jgi:alpha-L-rhamnosidase
MPRFSRSRGRYTVFYGDDAPARDAMKKYIAFMSAKADGEGLYDYGFGDWCRWWEDRKGTSVRLTDSTYMYMFNRRLAFWAERFGDKSYVAERIVAAEKIKAAFNAVFYKGGGMYAQVRLTELAAPLYFKGLCVDGEETKVVEMLVETVRKNGHRAYSGILGAKWVSRVLAEHGFADDAFRMFVQPDIPC